VYENYTISEIPKWVKKGGLALDVGAHVGIITLILSRLVGVSGKVVSFEPDPFTSKFFDKNLNWNKISNVTLVRAGVGKKDGNSRLYRSSEDPADNRLFNSDNRSESVKIKVVALDSRIKDKVDFIKIDVQGLENDVILGASKLIKKYKPVLLIEFWPEGLFAAKSSPFALYKSIKKHGYSIYALDDIYKKKIKIKNLDQLNSLCKTIGFINILCV
jgi:FkbM family methyltransferase